MVFSSREGTAFFIFCNRMSAWGIRTPARLYETVGNPDLRADPRIVFAELCGDPPDQFLVAEKELPRDKQLEIQKDPFSGLFQAEVINLQFRIQRTDQLLRERAPAFQFGILRGKRIAMEQQAHGHMAGDFDFRGFQCIVNLDHVAFFRIDFGVCGGEVAVRPVAVDDDVVDAADVSALQEPFADLVHQFPVGAFPEKRIDDFPHHLRPAENDEERHQQPGEAVHGDLGIYEAGDPTLLISNSGATVECVRLMPILKQFKSPTIALVGRPDSPMGQAADMVLDASVSSEADPLGIVPTNSTTVALAIGDALACALRLGAEAVLLRYPQISVFGAAYAAGGCYLVAFLLNLYYSIKERKNRIRIGGHALKFALLSAAAAGAAWPLRELSVFAALAAAAAVYLALSVPLRAFRPEEVRLAWRNRYDRTRRTWLQPR